MLGSAATGVAGGVIDKTLGNVLGIVGQGRCDRRRQHPERDLPGAQRLVDHDSPISGRVNIAGGVLVNKALVVQGDRAKANVATRTNLVNTTTDTTVNS